MSLCAWAGGAWARPGVGAALLALQDDHGQCVPLLIWALWLAERGGTSDEAATGRAAALCQSWDAEVIAPLRAERRRAVGPERERLLAEELAMEHDLLDRLEAFTGPGSVVLEDRLADLSTHWGRPLDPAAFGPLIEAFRGREPADVG